MLTPEYYNYCADEVIELYSKLDETITRDIARRIMKTGYVTDGAKWLINVEREAGLLYDEIIEKVAEHAEASEEAVRAVFNEAGLSSQLFSSTGSTTLKSSVKKDISIMMLLVNQYSVFLTNLINRLFGNINISFKYIFLPVGEQNWDDYIKSAKDLAALGYSWLIPAIAQGISQRDLMDLKKLENKALKLADLLIPLQSAFQSTQGSQNGPGAPKKEQDEKAEKTIKNEESLDNTAGGSN